MLGGKDKNLGGSGQKTIRVGLLGSGFMGVAHSNAYRSASIYDLPCKVEMAGVCSAVPQEEVEAFAEKFGWQSASTDWKAFVARDDIDVISVATPGDTHRDIVVEAAKHGKHILCEKPLANTLPEAVEMAEAVEKAGVRHCCGFSYRSTPSQALAARMVKDGKLGRIYHVFARYAQDWITDPEFPRVWRLDKKAAGSGSLGDIGAHIIDAARFITGMEITDVMGNLSTIINERPDPANPNGPKLPVTVDDVAQYFTKFKNGAVGTFEATRFATGRKNNNHIEINGELGSLYWDFEEHNFLYFYDKTQPVEQQGFTKIICTEDAHPFGGGPWPAGHGIGYGDSFIIEVGNFISAIVNGDDYAPNFNDGVAAQKVLDAVEKSSNEKKWVTV